MSRRRYGWPVEDIQNAEANAFAMELLMPRTFLQRDLHDKPRWPDGRPKLTDADIHELAKRYEVDVVWMTMRLVQLGYLSL